MSIWKFIFFITSVSCILDKLYINPQFEMIFEQLLVMAQQYIDDSIDIKYRLQMFIQNVKNLNDFNRQNTQVKLGLNQFTLLTDKEAHNFLVNSRTQLRQQQIQIEEEELQRQQINLSNIHSNNVQEFQYNWVNEILNFQDNTQRKYQDLYQKQMNECQACKDNLCLQQCIKKSNEILEQNFFEYTQQKEKIEKNIEKDFNQIKNNDDYRYIHEYLIDLLNNQYSNNAVLMEKSIVSFSESAQNLQKQQLQESSQDQTNLQETKSEDTQQKIDQKENKSDENTKETNVDEEQKQNEEPPQKKQNETQEDQKIDEQPQQESNETQEEQQQPSLLDLINNIDLIEAEEQNQPVVSPITKNNNFKKKFKTKYPKIQKIKKRENPFMKNSLFYKLFQLDKLQQDWQQKKKVTAVRDQGNCGSCWIFSALGTMESQLLIDKKKSQLLAVQQVLNCAPQEFEIIQDSCDGGLGLYALKTIRRMGGIQLEKELPYQEKTQKCTQLKQNEQKFNIKKIHFLQTSSDMEQFLLALSERPLAVAFHVSNTFLSYDQGIIDCLQPQFYKAGLSHLNHEALAVGYYIDMDNPEESYIKIKNQWSEQWGENGYFKFKLYNVIFENNKAKLIGAENYSINQQQEYLKNGPCGLLTNGSDTFWVTMKY